MAAGSGGLLRRRRPVSSRRRWRWGTYGFKAAPIVGKNLAELVATGRTPNLIAPFALERFYHDKLVSELAAAAVSH